MKVLSPLLLLFLLAPNLATAFNKPLESQRSRRHFSSYFTSLKASPSSSSNERKPWEFGRFLQQSSQFVLKNPFQSTIQKTIQPGNVLWEPNRSSSSSSSFSFGPLDDVVMGGASSSTFDNPTGTWTGTVTDANNGGFIGIRSFPSFQLDLRNCRGIELKIKGGDGKRFKIGLRDTTDFNGIVWTKSVDLGTPDGGLSILNAKKNDITTVKVPFNELVPTRFARIVPGQELKKENIAGIQIAYSKFEYNGELNPKFSLGDIRLQILEVKAY